MTLFIDSLWRAAAYCLHVPVILYSLLPLAPMVAIAFGAGWFFWEPAIDAISALLGSWHLVHAAHDWLAGVGLGGLKAGAAAAAGAAARHAGDRRAVAAGGAPR